MWGWWCCLFREGESHQTKIVWAGRSKLVGLQSASGEDDSHGIHTLQSLWTLCNPLSDGSPNPRSISVPLNHPLQSITTLHSSLRPNSILGSSMPRSFDAEGRVWEIRSMSCDGTPCECDLAPGQSPAVPDVGAENGRARTRARHCYIT